MDLSGYEDEVRICPPTKPKHSLLVQLGVIKSAINLMKYRKGVYAESKGKGAETKIKNVDALITGLNMEFDVLKKVLFEREITEATRVFE